MSPASTSHRFATLMVVACAALLALPGGAAAQGAPAFTELTGTAGCLLTPLLAEEQEAEGEDGAGCGVSGGLDRALSVVVSPDDRFVHVASGGTLEYGSNGVTTFRRDAGSGALEFASCISAGGGDGRAGSEGVCERGDALIGASDLALSPDGRRAYVAARGSNGAAFMDRDPATGALTPAGCVKEIKRRDRCDEAPPLLGASSIAVSPDGLDVYVGAPGDAAVHVLRRDATTGRLKSTQCLSQTGSDGLCDPAPGLRSIRDVLVSPAGGEVYAAGFDGVMTIFTRDPETGKLTPAGCLLHEAPERGPCQRAAGLAGAEDLTISPDGRDLYVAAGDEYGAVASFRRGDDGKLTQTGCLQYVAPPEEEEEEEQEEDAEASQDDALQPGCDPVRAYVSAFTETTLSADGRTLFAAGGDTVAMYRRDPGSGRLTSIGCAGPSDFEQCTIVGSLEGTNADSIAATSDGRNLYVASASGKLTVLGASVAIASSSARAARSGRVSLALRCPAARKRGCAGQVSLSGAAAPYRMRAGALARVQLKLGSKARRRLARRGTVSVIARALDRREVVRPTVRRVTVRR